MALPPTYVPGFHVLEAVQRMPYRKFGSRVVSQLSYGASALGGGECIKPPALPQPLFV